MIIGMRVSKEGKNCPKHVGKQIFGQTGGIFVLTTTLKCLSLCGNRKVPILLFL